eukprot:scaffold37341_cov17-Prasinocladus_malaysianus.AAC.1
MSWTGAWTSGNANSFLSGRFNVKLSNSVAFKVMYWQANLKWILLSSFLFGATPVSLVWGLHSIIYWPKGYQMTCDGKQDANHGHSESRDSRHALLRDLVCRCRLTSLNWIR